MVRDRGLADPATARELAGAQRVLGGQLAKDLEARGIGCRLQEEDIGVRLALHRALESRRESTSGLY